MISTLILTLVCTHCKAGWDYPEGPPWCPMCGSAQHVQVRDSHVAVPLGAVS